MVNYNRKKVCILGQEYTIYERSESEDKRLIGRCGFCDWTTKEIVLDSEISGDLGDIAAYKRKVLRHEIVHAFFLESGLHESCTEEEQLVDWIAIQGQKIYQVWEEIGALDLTEDVEIPTEFTGAVFRDVNPFIGDDFSQPPMCTFSCSD